MDKASARSTRPFGRQCSKLRPVQEITAQVADVVAGQFVAASLIIAALGRAYRRSGTHAGRCDHRRCGFWLSASRCRARRTLRTRLERTERIPPALARGEKVSHGAATLLDVCCTSHGVQSSKENWSGRRGSNPRPRPWQGRALPLSYTRIRDVGDRSPATAELCQMQAVNATVRTRPELSG